MRSNQADEHKHIPGQHDEEKNAERPCVAGGVVALALEDLGRSVVSRVAGCHEEAVGVAELLGKAEVDDAQRVVAVRVVHVEDVGGLEVAMHDAAAMQVVDGVDDHLEDGGRLALRQELLLEYVVEQLAAATQLEHEEQLVAVQKYLHDTQTNKQTT